MSFFVFEGRISNWADQRNLLPNTTLMNQHDKLMEEAAELRQAVDAHELEGIKDGIGDMVVVLTNMAHKAGLTLEECCWHAYNEIKDRTGIMFEGQFVKDGGHGKKR